MSKPKAKPGSMDGRFRFRGDTDPHEVTAVEITDVDAAAIAESGAQIAVGDFMVTRDGYEAQWWQRDSFIDQYEPV